MNSTKAKLNRILAWQASKPATDQAWAEDVKQESLDVKFDGQLVQMRGSLQSKILLVEDDLKWITKYPDHERKEIDEKITKTIKFGFNFDFAGKTIKQYIEDKLIARIDYYNWKTEKLRQSIERIEKEQDLRKRKVVSRKPIGTTYYIDSDNGNDGNDGLTTGAAWKTLDKFTEAGRAAGDIAILRRGMTARYDNASDLLFTSDGKVENPIIIEADYGDDFGDDVALTNTYTPTFGSKTITASATESQLVAGDWIVFGSDTKKYFAYEVASVSGTTITLYLPYKGDESGAGIAGVKMLSMPQWNLGGVNLRLNFNSDNFWQIQGLNMMNGGAAEEIVTISFSVGHVFIDCVLQGIEGDIAVYAIRVNGRESRIILKKCRTLQVFGGFLGNSTAGIFDGTLIDCLIDGSNAQVNNHGIFAQNLDRFRLFECEIKGHGTSGGDITTSGQVCFIEGRNILLRSPIQIDSNNIRHFAEVLLEDFNGVIGDSRQFSGRSTAEDVPIQQSDTVVVRSGGNNKSIKVIPSTEITLKWDFSRILLFEIPIYATTVEKTYKIFFNLPAAGFDSAPLATELWIEMEAWGHASNNHRKITKSTGTIIADGTWRSLTVTIAPLQTGVAYLRCYYAKTKEATKDNIFYADPLPVIT